MEWGRLSTYFVGVAAKRLSSVEVNPRTSNQHEFDGVQPFRAILGDQRIELPATVLWIPDDEEKRQQATGRLTWYDARERVATRSAEFRLYYPAEAQSVVHQAVAGDLLVLAITADRKCVLAIAPAGSSAEQQLLWLFGLPRELEEPTTKLLAEEGDSTLDATAAEILERIGVETQERATNLLDLMAAEFGLAFPSTTRMSAFARETAPDVSPVEDPDTALTVWFNHEELLFRTLEREIVDAKLRNGFVDVDDFMSFSLSVQNRRKARAGSALENHIEQILVANRVFYSRGRTTERRSRPDFIFPGIDQYHDADFPVARLTMLGAKSSCKERWRQILPEADRITGKHLLTLEPAISEAQTNEMRANNVQLVVPQGTFRSYTDPQQQWLLSVSGFIQLLLRRQAA